MSRALSKYRVLDAVKKYLESRGCRVEEIEDNTVVCRSSGESIAIRVVLPPSPGGILETMWEASAGCRSLSFDRVYIAVPSSFLRRVAGRRMTMLRDMLEGYHKVGLLRVGDEGDVEEVLAAPLRRLGPPEVNLPRLAGLPDQERSLRQALPSASTAPVREQRVQPGSEQAREPTAESSKPLSAPNAPDDLPDFARNNPWFNIFSRRGVGGK